MNKLLLLIALLLLGLGATAQDQMTLQEAIKLALEKNYNVQLSRNSVEMAQNQATRGQAGLLPTVSASGSYNYSLSNTKIRPVTQPEAVETNGAVATTTRASVNGNYTIFSGMSNSNTFDKLVLNANLSDAQSRVQVESVILQVTSLYFNVLRAKNNYDALKESNDISKDRLTIAETKKELSGGTKTEVLSAKVDLNKDNVNLVSAKQAYEEAQIAFNEVLNRPLDAAVSLVEYEQSIVIENLESLKSEAQKMNWQLQSAKLNEQVSMLDYKIAKSSYMPQLDLSASYSYSNNQAEGSFLAVNQSDGLGLGLTLSIPLYTGGTRQNAIKNAQILMENQELQLQQTQLALDADLLIAYKDYERAVEIVQMEKENLALNEENFEYTKKQFELGLVTSIVYRQAQVNLLLTKNNYNNVVFNQRLAEIELQRLTGGLVKDL